jgi:cobalt/nickel transport system permease protein
VSARRGFAESLARHLARALTHAFDTEALAARAGLLQRLDPRVKLVGALALIVSVVLTHALSAVVVLFALALLLARASRIAPLALFGPLWLSVLLFSGAVALPALLVVPGDALGQLPLTGWTVTRQGLRSAAFLVARAETSSTLALLLIATTPWAQLLKALRVLGVPLAVVAILAMTQRYIVVLMQNAAQIAQARRSRIVAPMSGAQQRRMAVATAGVLLEKAVALGNEVHLAMISRGYRGEVSLLDEFRARPRDGVALALALGVPLAILWLER